MRWSTRITGSLRNLAIWTAVLLTWEAAYRLIGWADYIFPAPSHVLDALLSLMNITAGFGEPVREGWPWVRRAEGAIWITPLVEGITTSLLRLGVGFVISIGLGSVLGLLMWRLRVLDELLGPLFLGLQTLPSVCWVPLAIIFFGLSETGILFVLVMGSFFAAALSLRDGLRTIPPIYRRAGDMLGAHGAKMYLYVLLPASLPAVAGSLRSGFSFAWRSLMGAELLYTFARWHGLGFLLHIGRETNDAGMVVAVMAMMVAIGILADRLVFERLERAITRRFGLAVAE
jgi:NitT/TauT family transport system permease protein